MTETSSHPALAPADAPARNRLAVAALVIAAASVVAAAGFVMATLALGPDFAALLFVAAAYIVPLLLSVVALVLGIAALGRPGGGGRRCSPSSWPWRPASCCSSSLSFEDAPRSL